MSSPSKKKTEKQKERQKKLAEKSVAAERKAVADRKRRLYAETFPEVVFIPGNAAPEFVEVIRHGVAKLNFENREQFGKRECGFFATLKLEPVEAERFLHSLKETDMKGHVHLMTIIGSLVFKMEHDRIKPWIPFNNVCFWLDFRHGQILAKFDALLEQKSQRGTIYYSRHRPMLEIDGEMKTVGWRKHAVERVCERLTYDWQSYPGLGDAFAFVNRCMHFDRSVLYPDQLAFTFFNSCIRGFSSERMAEFVVGDESKVGEWFYRLGYGVADVEGDFVVARTVLFPGYDKTPEHSLIVKSKLPRADKDKMKQELRDMDFQTQVSHPSFGYIKWFHDNGVPQVVRGEPQWFAPL